MSRINAAIEKLLGFPNPQDVAAAEGSCDSRMEDRAMKFVALAAQFVGVLDDEGKGQELRQRALRFRSFTHAGSQYDKFRELAYQRIVKKFSHAAPGGDADRLSVAQLREPDRFASLPVDVVEDFIEAAYVRKVQFLQSAPPEIEYKDDIKSEALEAFTSETNSDDLVLRSDVDAIFAPDSILWQPYEVEDFCWSLAWLLGYEELTILAVELTWIFQRITVHHLWGSFLLDAARTTVLPTGDSHHYERLLKTIMSSEPAFPSILDAAEDLVAAAQGKYGHMSAEDRDVLQIGLKAIAAFSNDGETTETAKGESREPGGSTSQSGQASSGAEQSASPKLTIKVSRGHRSFQLKTEGRPPVSIEGMPLYPLFWLFVARLAKNAPTETVTLKELNTIVGDKEEGNRASEKLRGCIGDLRVKLAELGSPPDGKEFIQASRRKGYRLNKSCDWHVTEEVRRECGRVSRSVGARWTDAQAMAERTVDDDDELSTTRDRRCQDDE
jgi:hypothetical protein